MVQRNRGRWKLQTKEHGKVIGQVWEKGHAKSESRQEDKNQEIGVGTVWYFMEIWEPSQNRNEVIQTSKLGKAWKEMEGHRRVV